MKRLLSIPMGLMLLAGAGCYQANPPPQAQAPSRPRESPDPFEQVPARERSSADVSYETQRDARFGEFVRRTAGDMVDKVAVGLERKGILRVQLGKATAPEDTLPLTKSLVAGARKDFPGKPITVSVYDPSGEPILKAHYRPDEGVHYEVVGSESASARRSPRDASEESEASSPDGSSAGTTAKDRRFASWAMEKGHRYLRYVQADLERKGRLWFGVTQETKPDDVADLTKALLQGARTEFPRGELTATVFDPDGERIGNATLESNGKLHWSR